MAYGAAPRLVRAAFPLLVLGSCLALAGNLPLGLLFNDSTALAICGFLSLTAANIALVYYILMEELAAHAKLLTILTCCAAGLGAVLMIAATAKYMDEIGKTTNGVKPHFQGSVAISGGLMVGTAAVLLLLDLLGMGGGPGSGRTPFGDGGEPAGMSEVAVHQPPSTVDGKTEY